MSVKPAPPKPADHGAHAGGKGLDALDRFIIQSWGPRGRFGVWTEHAGHLSEPKASVESFLNAHLESLWHRDEVSAVVTLEPPYDPFVTLKVFNDHRHLGPESKYKPSHWSWKVVPSGEAVPTLRAALAAELPEVERAYLEALREGSLREEWSAASPK
ncbi:MAG TPA: hypothetical protein VJ570_07245 [Holophagaceae bacterium]|nr:hypothetical protein [Holophagaceae bacterium]